MKYENLDLRMKMNEAHITHEELAKVLGVHRITVSRWLCKKIPEETRARILEGIIQIEGNGTQTA